MSEEIKKVIPETETEPTATTVANDVRTKLAEYGADEATIDKIVNDLGVETLEDLAMLDERELTGAGIKLVKARKLLAELSNATESTPTEKVAASAMAFSADFNSILPTVPDG